MQPCSTLDTGLLLDDVPCLTNVATVGFRPVRRARCRSTTRLRLISVGKGKKLEESTVDA